MPRHVDARQKEILQRDVRRLMRTISPKINPVSRYAIEPRWTELSDRHGRVSRVRCWHVFLKNDERHPSLYQPGDTNWLGSFAYQDEAISFAMAAARGRVQIAMGSGPAQGLHRFEVRTFSGNEAPQVEVTDSGPETR